MDLNVIDMFWQASLMIKLVILLLLYMSLYSWYIVFSKMILYRKVRQESDLFVERFWKCKDLSEAYRFARESTSAPPAQVFVATYQELQRLNKNKNSEQAGLESRLAGMELLKRAANKSLSLETASLGRSLPFLASTGSASPFIGLFGTVWGIMNSFHEIGLMGTASLAVVAPGVSEALVVTAAGLAVAIPAVVTYNHYTNQLNDIEGATQGFAVDFLNLIERDFLARRGE